MLFFSFFKTLVGKEACPRHNINHFFAYARDVVVVLTAIHGLAPPAPHAVDRLEVTVELKNDLAITGTLHSVDQYLNIKLENVQVVNEDKFPHMLSVRNCFIRGSVVRYVQLPPTAIDTELLHDSTRREIRGQ